MSAVSAWLRRRLDSSGSSEGAAHAEEFGSLPVSPSLEEEQQFGKNFVRKTARRLTEPPSVTYETETSSKTGGRRSRHLSIGDPNVGTPIKEESGSAYVKVKSQWQRAVRKISVSSGYNSGASSTSSTPAPNGDSSPTGGVLNRVRRTSVDKPSWGVRAAYGGQVPDQYYHPAQPRTRHLSLSSNIPPSVYHYSQSPPRVVLDEQGLTKPVPANKIPTSMMVNQSPPVISTLAMVRESKASPARKSSSPDNDCDDCDDCDDDDSMSKLPYAVGKATPFPDGSEAVMIDSALAHNAFQEELVRAA